MTSVKVTVVTVVYGKRWPFLEQVAKACLQDNRVSTFVIVDNGCGDAVAMDAYAKQYEGRVVILRQEKNIGYSGAINKGMTFARTSDCDYVLILDDDSVPEAGAIDHYMHNLELFPHKNIILVGNRIDVPGNADIFTTRHVYGINRSNSLYQVFSFKKLVHFLRVLFKIHTGAKQYPYVPIIPVDAFVTGGTFLPIAAVRAVEPPDASFFIYSEDLDYAWRLRAAGYEIYACAQPVIRDIDMTFPNIGDHVYGLFKEATPEYKVFFRMRNTVVVSRRHSGKSALNLGLNVAVWYIGLLVIGLVTVGPSKVYVKRAKLIARALYRGFKLDTSRPDFVTVPG